MNQVDVVKTRLVTANRIELLRNRISFLENKIAEMQYEQDQLEAELLILNDLSKFYDENKHDPIDELRAKSSSVAKTMSTPIEPSGRKSRKDDGNIILMHLATNGPTATSELKETFGLTQIEASTILKRLIRNGWIGRSNDDEWRSPWRLTDSGKTYVVNRLQSGK